MASLVHRALHWPSTRSSGYKQVAPDNSYSMSTPRADRDRLAGLSGSTTTYVTAAPAISKPAPAPAPAPAPVQQQLTPPPERSPDSTQPRKTRRTTATVYVGPDKQRFRVDRKLLCGASSFFSDRLDDPAQPRSVSLWLPGELPAMFALFVQWLQLPRHRFRLHLDDVVADAHCQRGQRGLHDVHWALIRLHLFASHLGLLHLQDVAMDAIQDLYLDCDWDLPPALLSYLYTRCEALPAVRLRRWAVAMVAFALTGAQSNPDTPASTLVELYAEYDRGFADFHNSTDDIDDDGYNDGDERAHRFQSLINSIPELSEDYAVHLTKMSGSGLDVRFKNPQLRIPANKLRNDERAFGFRECSFHSHRATVGERRCPHERKRLRGLAAESAAAEAQGGRPVNFGAGAVPVADHDQDRGNHDSDGNIRRYMLSKLGGTNSVQPSGMEPPVRRPSRRGGDAADRETAHRHVRSLSSTQR